MKLSACMPTRGRAQQAKLAIERFFETTRGHDVEMVVVAHPDESIEILGTMRHPRLKIYFADCTAIEGWNIAASYATGDFLKVWDDDLWPTPGWLDEAEKTWVQAGSPEIVYMGLWDLSPEIPETCFSRAIGSRKFFVQICGGVLCIPGYKSWFEDRQKFWMAKAAGCTLYCPESVIHHRHVAVGYADDATYALGRSRQGNDEAIYNERKAAGFQIEWKSIFR